jgi:hypothetical protein
MFWEGEERGTGRYDEQRESECAETAETADPHRARLIVARRALMRALLRLKVAERNGSLPKHVQRIRQTYAEAEAELRSAWVAWRDVRDMEARVLAVGADRAAAQEQDVAEWPEPVRQRLAFARWLVQTGRLTEQR